MDGPEAGAVAGGHVLVERLNGVGAAHLTVLFVHVVGAGTRVVSDPDTEVLDLERMLLVDLSGGQYLVHPVPIIPIHILTHLVERDDLTVRLLDLSELREEVPESALGNDIVWSKDAHAVELWGRVGITWKVTANDLVFLESARHFCGRPDGNQNQQPSYKMCNASEKCMCPLPSPYTRMNVLLRPEVLCHHCSRFPLFRLFSRCSSRTIIPCSFSHIVKRVRRARSRWTLLTLEYCQHKE